MVAPRVNSAPHDVESQRPAPSGRDIIPSPDHKMLQYVYNSYKTGTTTVVFPVDTAPHGVETPTPMAEC